MIKNIFFLNKRKYNVNKINLKAKTTTTNCVYKIKT